MVEHRAPRLPNSQSPHQLCVAASSQPIGQQRGALGPLLGMSRKAGEHPHRPNIGQVHRQPLPDFRILSVPSREQDLSAEGAEHRSWRTALAAPSR